MILIYFASTVLSASIAHGRNPAISPTHPMQRRGTSHAPWAGATTQLNYHDQDQIRMLQSNGGGEASRLRSDLLSNYDRGAFPWEYAWTQAGWNETTGVGNRTGLHVEVGINFHRVFAVDIKKGVADLIVWFRQRWTDPRLAWDPEEYGGLDTAYFWIGEGVGGAEASEIWTPDITLWNMEVAMKDTLTDSYATVDSSGTVFWSRPGHLRPACKFEGLDSFPFDALSCTMEFGSWVYTGLYLRPVKMDEGFSIGGSDTAGEAFAEYRLFDDNAIQCREVVYPPFINSPEEDWPVLMYDIAFHRSWQPYVRGYVLMQVILNFCGFGAFWLPVHSGERMGLVITSMLAAVASELVVAASLPTAAEMTWFQEFSLFSLSFAAFALFESVAVIYFFYYTGTDLVPKWWKWLRSKVSAKDWRCTRNRKNKNDSDQRENRHSAITELEASDNSNGEKDVAAASGNSDESHDESEKGDEFDEGSPRIDNPPNSPNGPGSFAMRRSTEPQFADSLASLRQDTTRALFRQSMREPRRDADDFRDVQESENNRRWQAVSKSIDDFCRVVIPVVYLIVFGILLNQVEFF